MYLLAIFSGLMIATKYRKAALDVIKKSHLGFIAKLFLLLAAYITLITLVSGGFSDIYFIDSMGKMLLTGPALVLCLAYLLLEFKSRKYTINDALKIIMYAGLIQVGISLASFVYPDLKMFLISVMQRNVGTAALYDQFQIESRLFGFAGDMFDRFGYGMGMLSVIPVLLAYNTRRMRYLITLPLFIVATILNSRTGILILIVAVLPMVLLVVKKFILNTRNARMMISSFFIIGLTIAGGIYVVNSVYDNGNDNIKGYTISNYQSIFDYVTGEESSATERDNTAERLFSDRSWEVPCNLFELVFGTGHSKYEIKGLSHSDVGYTNDIWMFGVLGALITYFSLSRFTFNMYKYGIQYKFLTIGLMLSFFIYQIKGVALWSANFGISVHIMMVAVVSWYYSQHDKEQVSLGARR